MATVFALSMGPAVVFDVVGNLRPRDGFEKVLPTGFYVGLNVLGTFEMGENAISCRSAQVCWLRERACWCAQSNGHRFLNRVVKFALRVDRP